MVIGLGAIVAVLIVVAIIVSRLRDLAQSHLRMRRSISRSGPDQGRRCWLEQADTGARDA